MGSQVDLRTVYKTGHKQAGRVAIDLTCPSKLYLESVLDQAGIPLSDVEFVPIYEN